jgi:hypothetical protein
MRRNKLVMYHRIKIKPLYGELQVRWPSIPLHVVVCKLLI